MEPQECVLCITIISWELLFIVLQKYSQKRSKAFLSPNTSIVFLSSLNTASLIRTRRLTDLYTHNKINMTFPSQNTAYVSNKTPRYKICYITFRYLCLFPIFFYPFRIYMYFPCDKSVNCICGYIETVQVIQKIATVRN